MKTTLFLSSLNSSRNRDEDRESYVIKELLELAWNQFNAARSGRPESPLRVRRLRRAKALLAAAKAYRNTLR